MPKAKKPVLSDLITQLFQLKVKRDKLAAAKAVLDKQASELEDLVIASFTATELTSARNKLGQVTRVVENVPQADDWEKIYAWIKKTDRFELLHKRLSREVWLEQLAAKKPVPGVTTFGRVSLRLTSAKGKRS